MLSLWKVKIPLPRSLPAQIDFFLDPKSKPVLEPSILLQKRILE